ncbi:MAG TPA: hypothetical protein VJ801_01445 [Polyangia bacterium]|nr:hypothetical protein [Polyangia bacterium]
MSRPRCLGLGACLALSLTAMACGSGGSSAWDQARIGDTGTNWWLNIRKGAYFFSVQLRPSYTESATVRSMVVSFAQTVVGKLTSGSPAPATLVPGLSELPGPTGWTLDPDQVETANGVATASNEIDATTLIDGGAAPFFVAGSYSATGLAWERWANVDYLMDLKVWQMVSAADATKLYGDLLNNPLYSNITWTTCSGAAGANPCP